MLRALGITEGQPFELKLMRWLPEILSVKAVKGLLESRFAAVAFAMHARAAHDEMGDLAREFQKLTARTSVDTPNIDALRSFIPAGGGADQAGGLECGHAAAAR